MAGLIDKKMAPPTEAPEPAEGAPEDVREDAAEGAPEGSPANEKEDAAEGGALSPEKVDAAIKMPPELQNAYERVVVAGMKVMFDQSSHQAAMQQLQSGQGPIADRLGKAIAGLMLLLLKQSNATMPPAVIIPAGTSLLVRAADFLSKSESEPISEEEIGEALSVMVETLLSKFNLDPAKVLAAGYNSENIPQEGPQPEAAPGQKGLVDQAAAAPPQAAEELAGAPVPSEKAPQISDTDEDDEE